MCCIMAEEHNHLKPRYQLVSRLNMISSENIIGKSRYSFVAPILISRYDSFVRSDDEDDEQSWEQRVAKKYYDKLFKEYAICELKYYKEGKIALRWRTEKEVILGKGIVSIYGCYPSKVISNMDH